MTKKITCRSFNADLESKVQSAEKVSNYIFNELQLVARKKILLTIENDQGHNKFLILFE